MQFPTLLKLIGYFGQRQMTFIETGSVTGTITPPPHVWFAFGFPGMQFEIPAMVDWRH
jgi:hypothetical protein